MVTERVAEVQVCSQLEEEGRQKKLVKVALDTLAEVDFGQHMLLGFTQDVILSYACSEDETVRKSAALAAWKVTERQWSVLRCDPLRPFLNLNCESEP
jgi:hypothetical protein